MQKVVLLEDDSLLSPALKSTLSELGLTCEAFPSLSAAESRLGKPEPFAALVDLNIPTANSSIIKKWKDHSDSTGGLAFIRAAKQKWRRTKFILLTGQPSLDAKKWCDENDVHYSLKPISKSQIANILGLRQSIAFVVHGRDLDHLKKTKEVLASLSILPVVLLEQPSKGKTVIEKFEAVSEKCDYAIVVMSPDDVGVLKSDATAKARLRVRQNVIFELGFFYGHFGRTSGKVILIEFGDTEIPSDIVGIVRVDGTTSKNRLIEQLKTELTVPS